jgi:putative flippase GtrA
VSRAARFVGVGVGGFAVQGLALHLLAAAGLPYLLATAVAVEAAILHNFLWHERWTWADRVVPSRHDRLVRFARFNGSTAFISIGGNVALMGLFAGRLRLPLLAANLLAVLTLSVLNFLAADRLVFATTLTHQPTDPTPM